MNTQGNPKYNSNIELILRKKNELVVNNLITRLQIILDIDEVSSYFLSLIDGQKSVNELKEYMKVKFNKNLSKDIDDYLAFLYQKKIIEYNELIVQPELVRYKDQLHFFNSFIKEYDTSKLHGLLKNKKVCILGLGGTGNHIARSLCALGIGQLILNDDDYVEEKNLPRQTLYMEQDVGLLKAETAIKRLKQMNKDLSLKSFTKRIGHSEDLRDIISGADLVINCMDEPSMEETSMLLDDICHSMNIPFITGGGYSAHFTAVGYLIIPGKTLSFKQISKAIANYESDLSVFINHTNNNKNNGSLGPLANIIANLQVVEALKYLTKFADPIIVDHYVEFDFIGLNIKKINLRKFSNDAPETLNEIRLV